MIITGSKGIEISGRDAASYFYNTQTGIARLNGVAYWLLGRKVTVPERKFNNMIWHCRESHFIDTFLHSRKTKAVSHAEKPLPEQQYANSCGAQALRQVAYELGVSHLPKKKRYGFKGQSIEDKTAEIALYAITGDLLDNSKKRLEIRPENGGYSFPGRMAFAAKALGLDARIYSSKLLPRLYLKNKFSIEWFIASTVCPANNCSPPELSVNERYIHLLITPKDTSFLHWVMERPDGSCYDPETGCNYKTLKEYKQLYGLKSTGITLLISDRNAYPGTPGKTARTTPPESRLANDG